MQKHMTAVVVVVALAATVLAPRVAIAQEERRVGAHIGFVLPLVTRTAGQTVTVADDFVFGMPSGFAVKKFGRFVVDLEVVPGVQNEPRDLSLVLHPGVVFGVRDQLAAGIRMAFDVEGEQWGFTPLLNRTLYNVASHRLFGELVLPVRFVDAPGGSRTAIGVGVHVGVGF